jgi:hypothetical protein
VHPVERGCRAIAFRKCWLADCRPPSNHRAIVFIAATKRWCVVEERDGRDRAGRGAERRGGRKELQIARNRHDAEGEVIASHTKNVVGWTRHALASAFGQTAGPRMQKKPERAAGPQREVPHAVEGRLSGARQYTPKSSCSRCKSARQLGFRSSYAIKQCSMPEPTHGLDQAYSIPQAVRR